MPAPQQLAPDTLQYSSTASDNTERLACPAPASSGTHDQPTAITSSKVACKSLSGSERCWRGIAQGGRDGEARSVALPVGHAAASGAMQSTKMTCVEETFLILQTRVLIQTYLRRAVSEPHHVLLATSSQQCHVLARASHHVFATSCAPSRALQASTNNYWINVVNEKSGPVIAVARLPQGCRRRLKWPRAPLQGEILPHRLV